MIQLKDKLKVNGGTRRYMEMIGLSLAFSLFAVSCTQDSDTFYPSSPEEEHPSVDESRMIPIQLSVDGVDQFYGGAVTRSGETVARLVQPLDSTYDTGYDVETTVESIPLENIVSTRANLGNVQFRVVAYRTDASSAGHYAGTAVYKTNGSGVAAIVAKTATPVNSAGQWILGPGTYTFVCYSYGLNSAPTMLSGNWSATVSHNQDFMLCRKEGVVVAPDDRGEFTLGGISFTRQCALLQLAVTANDFTNNTVQQCAATVSNLNSNSITWNAGQTALSTGGTGSAAPAPCSARFSAPSSSPKSTPCWCCSAFPPGGMILSPAWSCSGCWSLMAACARR